MSGARGGWLPIASAPKFWKIDLWAKRWNSVSDTFQGYRFTDCSWRERSDNTEAGWRNLDPGWVATHWMERPEPPADWQPLPQPPGDGV